MRLAASSARGATASPVPTAGRPGPARPPVPVHRVADHRRGGPAGRRRRPGRPRRRTRRDLAAAAARAALEGGVPQRVGPDVVLGRRRLRRRHLPARRAGGRARRRRAATRWPRRWPRPGARPARSRAAAPAVAAHHPVAVPGRPLGPHPADHLGRAGLRRARRLVVRARRRAGLALRQRRRLRGQAALAGGCRRPATGRRARAAGPGPVVAGGRGPPRPEAAAGGGGRRRPRTGVLRVGVTGDVRRRGRVAGGPWPRWPPVAPGLAVEQVDGGRTADLARPAGRGVGRGGRAGGRLSLTCGRRRPGRRRRAGRGGGARRRPGRGARAGRRRRSTSRSPPARCSTRWCCAPTASAPPTRRSAGSGPRGSPWTTTGRSAT